MLNYYESNDPRLTVMERKLAQVEFVSTFQTGLAQSFAAYRNEQYALVIPFLLLVLEHALRQFDPPRRHPRTDMKATVKNRYKISKDESMLFGMKSVLSFTENHYDQYNPGKDSEGRLFRHGVMHGLQAPPN